VLGATATVATGGGVTVTAAVPDALPLVAVIVAVPAVTPVTTPVAETVATDVGAALHVTVRPVSTLPAASLTVAVSGAVAPTATLTVLGVMVTLAAGTSVTVIVELPVCPSLVAVTIDVPGATAVTTPVDDTVATAGVPELHVIVRPVSTLPAASFNVAVSGAVAPTLRLADAGVTVTLATGTGVTVTVAVPDAFPLVAVIVAVPTLAPVTTPVGDTFATEVGAALHVTVRPVSTLPAASLTVAVSGAVAPTTTLTALGVTVTLAAGTGVTVMAAVAFCPPLVALMFAAPAATAVTTPVGDTVATDGLSVLQVTVRPVRTLPAASLSVGTSVTV